MDLLLRDNGERAAFAMLEKAGITYKTTEDGIRLRFGERGRLTPVAETIFDAILMMIDEGPITRVSQVMVELHLAAALSLTTDPDDDVFPLLDECLDIAAWMESREENPENTKAGTVLKFPVLNGENKDE
jgi:hypothetical protein